MNKADLESEAKLGWWNGVNILIKDKENYVKRNLAPEANKDLYFISHDIFRNKYASKSYDILKLASNSDWNGISGLLNEFNSNSDLFEHQNTYSENLTNFNLL